MANKDELSDVISYFIKQFGDRCSLNWLNVSFVRNMHNLFFGSTFNGDISMWDVSHVVDMYQMFRESSFNGDISNWDVSNVLEMEGMFHESSFNGDISKWNVKSVTNMNWMFRESSFNGDISKWDVSNVESMHGTFATSKFRGDISGWDVSNVKDMAFMFAWSEFDGNIDNWNPVKVRDFLDIFNSCPLDSNPPKWYNKPVKESFDFNGISKEKTIMFWASKAAMILALVLFFLPFMEIPFTEDSHLSAFAKPIEMTGRELVFGIDDDNDANESTSDSLRNGRVILAAIVLITAIVIPRGAGATAVCADVLLLLFVKNADKSYTFMKKTIRDWDGLIELKFQPALYAAIILIGVGCVLAFMDEAKRKKMFAEEQSLSLDGGYM